MEQTAEQCYESMVGYHRNFDIESFDSPKYFYKKYGGELLQTGGGVMLAIKIFSDKKVLSISGDTYILSKWIGESMPTIEEVYDALDFEGELEKVKQFYF